MHFPLFRILIRLQRGQAVTVGLSFAYRYSPQSPFGGAVLASSYFIYILYQGSIYKNNQVVLYINNYKVISSVVQFVPCSPVSRSRTVIVSFSVKSLTMHRSCAGFILAAIPLPDIAIIIPLNAAEFFFKWVNTSRPFAFNSWLILQSGDGANDWAYVCSLNESILESLPLLLLSW